MYRSEYRAVKDGSLLALHLAVRIGMGRKGMRFAIEGRREDAYGRDMAREAYVTMCGNGMIKAMRHKAAHGFNVTSLLLC